MIVSNRKRFREAVFKALHGNASVAAPLVDGFKVKYTEVKWGRKPWNTKLLSVRKHNARTGRSEQFPVDVQVGRKGRYGFHPSSKPGGENT